MNKYFVLGLIAICAASASAGRIVRDAPAAATPSPLGQLLGGFEETFNKLHTSFLDLWGVKSDADLLKLVEDQSAVYGRKLQTIATDLGEEAKKNAGVLDAPIAEMKAKLSTVISELEASRPELMADSKKYQEQFETQMRSIMTETEKFREKLKGESGPVIDKFEKVAKELYETTVNTATTYSKQVENTLKDNKVAA